MSTSSRRSSTLSTPDTEMTPSMQATASRIADELAETYKKRAALTDGEDDHGPSPTKRKRAGKKSAVVEDEGDEEVAPTPEVKKKPAAARGRKKKALAPTTAATEETEVKQEGEEEEDVKPPVKKPRKKPEPKLDENGNPIKRRRAPKPEPVYVIPPIETHLSTDFRGRLGYACLNTILRKKKPDPVFCSRTLRIATIKEKGMDYMKELGRQNAKDLLQLIQWNEDNNIRFMRLSSEMFPFASHEEYGYSLDYARKELEEAGALARKYGHRLTTHPGQFTQLTSPTLKTVVNAKRDLIYHCSMLDLMGMGPDSVMIIHGGGLHGDKPAAIERLRKYFKELPKNVADRLVLENDEICYNSDDLLPICEELEIPHVFDYHHDWIYPSKQSVAELMPRILATWNVRGGIRPKFHLSEPRTGAQTKMERRAHSDRIKRLPDVLPPDVDLMLEAKDKEQAVLELYRIYDLAAVKHESLRPPAEVETLHTAGRKSHKPKKKKAEEGEQEDAGEESPLTDLDDLEEEASPTKPKQAAGKKRKTKQEKVEAEPPEVDDGLVPNPEESQPAKPERTKKAASKDKPPEATTVEAAPEIEPDAVKKQPKRKRAAPKVTKEEEDAMDEM